MTAAPVVSPATITIFRDQATEITLRRGPCVETESRHRATGGVGGRALLVGEQVGIGLGRRGDGLVAEPALEDEQVGPGRDHPRGVRVAEVVHTGPFRQPRCVGVAVSYT